MSAGRGAETGRAALATGRLPKSWRPAGTARRSETLGLALRTTESWRETPLTGRAESRGRTPLTGRAESRRGTTLTGRSESRRGTPLIGRAESWGRTPLTGRAESWGRTALSGGAKALRWPTLAGTTKARRSIAVLRPLAWRTEARRLSSLAGGAESRRAALPRMTIAGRRSTLAWRAESRRPALSRGAKSRGRTALRALPRRTESRGRATLTGRAEALGRTPVPESGGGKTLAALRGRTAESWWTAETRGRATLSTRRTKPRGRAAVSGRSAVVLPRRWARGGAVRRGATLRLSRRAGRSIQARAAGHAELIHRVVDGTTTRTLDHPAGLAAFVGARSCVATCGRSIRERPSRPTEIRAFCPAVPDSRRETARGGAADRTVTAETTNALGAWLARAWW